jgi:hypothetical protein
MSFGRNNMLKATMSCDESLMYSINDMKTSLNLNILYIFGNTRMKT